MGISELDVVLYAGHIVIWFLVWSAYLLWANATGRHGIGYYILTMGICGAASVAYYAATDMVLTAYYSITANVFGW